MNEKEEIGTLPTRLHGAGLIINAYINGNLSQARGFLASSKFDLADVVEAYWEQHAPEMSEVLLFIRRMQ